jgi:hypothetical protein
MTQVILGKSRVREICMPGSVRAKAKWLSYSTIPVKLGRFWLRLMPWIAANQRIEGAPSVSAGGGGPTRLALIGIIRRGTRLVSLSRAFKR